MSTLEQIIEAARTLPPEDRRRLHEWLRAQERLDKVTSSPKETVEQQVERFHKALKWIDEHRAEYLGQWVALVGDKLIAHGPRAVQVHQAAKAAGIVSPFVERVVEKEEGAFWGGWLS